MDEPVIVQPKPFYLSKMVILGILLTLSGAVPLAVDLANKSAITAADVILFVGGLLTVILRIWFTDVPIA